MPAENEEGVRLIKIDDVERVSPFQNEDQIGVLFRLPDTAERFGLAMPPRIGAKLFIGLMDSLRRDGKAAPDERRLPPPSDSGSNQCFQPDAIHLHPPAPGEDGCILEIELDFGLRLAFSLPFSLLESVVKAGRLHLDAPRTDRAN